MTHKNQLSIFWRKYSWIFYNELIFPKVFSSSLHSISMKHPVYVPNSLQFSIQNCFCGLFVMIHRGVVKTFHFFFLLCYFLFIFNEFQSFTIFAIHSYSWFFAIGSFDSTFFFLFTLFYRSWFNQQKLFWQKTCNNDIVTKFSKWKVKKILLVIWSKGKKWI